MALTPRQVFRLYETDGVPDSGAHEPKKAEIIQLLDLLYGSSRGGWVVARTRAELLAIVPAEETDGGVVLNDPNPALNGYYQREAGVWVRERGFPDTLARLTVSGGTVNAVQATAEPGVDPSSVLAFFVDIENANTGNVTVTINGGAPIPALNVNGDQFEAGEFAGRLFLSNEGSSLRALNDANAAASAAASASDAADSSSEAAGYAALLEAGVHIDFATVALLLADTELGYGAEDGRQVIVGQIIGAQGFRYEVAAGDASDEHLETAGGVNLYARPDTHNCISTEQFDIQNGTESPEVQAVFEVFVRACMEQGATLFQPEWSDIWLSDTVTIRSIATDMRGRIFRNHATEPALIIGGDSNERNSPVQRFREILNLGGFDYPAFIIKGFRGSYMFVQRFNSVLLYADTALALGGTDDNIAYNVFDFPDGGQIDIDANPATDGAAAQWVNENRFMLKRTSRIYMGRNYTGYEHNHNIFETPNVEGSEAAIIIINSGSHNQIRDARFEGDPSITFGANARNNTIGYSWQPNAEFMRDPGYLWRTELITENGRNNNVVYTPGRLDIKSTLFAFNARQHRTFSVGSTAHIGGCEHKLITAAAVGFETVSRASGSTIVDWTPLIPFPRGSRVTVGCDAATVRPGMRFYDANRQLVTSEPIYAVQAAVTWSSNILQPTSTNGSYFGLESLDDNVAFIRLRVVGGSAALPFSTLYAELWNKSAETLDIASRFSLDRIGEGTRTDAAVPSRGVPDLGQVVRSVNGTASRCDYRNTTETTAAAGASNSTISVPTGHNAPNGGHIAVGLTNGSVHWTTVASSTATVITLNDALPSSAPNGARVELWSWV